MMNWKGDNCHGKYPASSIVKHRLGDLKGHAQSGDRFTAIPPENR